MTVISEEPDGRFAILPPYKSKYKEEGCHGKIEVTQGVISLCSGELLEKETETKPAPYYLFRRP